MLIKILNSEDHFNKYALNKSLLRIRNTLKEFESVASFHILRELNKHADYVANKACRLSQGNLIIKGEPNKFYLIPLLSFNKSRSVNLGDTFSKIKNSVLFLIFSKYAFCSLCNWLIRHLLN